MNNIYAEIRIDFYDEEDRVFTVDAWCTDKDNEEGKVIATIDPVTKEVKYLDKKAETDPHAQEEITLFLAGLDANISDKEV